jgi:hypothetical protein
MKPVTVQLSPKLHSKLCVDARVCSCSVEDLIVLRLQSGYGSGIEDEGLLRRFARKLARERRNRTVVIGQDGLRV